MDKFKMVPVEPTEEMLKAMDRMNQGAPMFTRTFDVKRSEYSAMLAAAPAPIFDEAADRAFTVKCSFCENTDAAGNPFIGGHSNNNGKLEYRVWGCKDHHDMANAALACARLKAGQPS